MCCGEENGACSGIERLTPLSTFNRPGRASLSYRVGTHGAFLGTMKARLSTMVVDAEDGLGGTVSYRPLEGLTMRSGDDPSIALLDAWATVGDVLTFYQERIAQEGYLRTATERRSVVEMARLVGYEPRPGVSASVFLAYTIDDNQADPVVIPAGARSQSIPGPDEFPQAFETGEDFEARREWNNLQVRLQRPQDIRIQNVLAVNRLVVEGTDTRLKPGDLLLFQFGSGTERAAIRRVGKVEGQFEAKRTVITLQPNPSAAIVAAYALEIAIQKFYSAVTLDVWEKAKDQVQRVRERAYLGAPFNRSRWVEDLQSMGDAYGYDDFDDVFVEILDQAQPPTNSSDGTTDPSKFVEELLKPKNVQPRTGADVRRSVGSTFAYDADVNSRLLLDFAPALNESYYQAWANANIATSSASLNGVYALRTEASLFGANLPLIATYDADNRVTPLNEWSDWTAEIADADGTYLHLEGSHPSVSSNSLALTELNGVRDVVGVTDARIAQRSAYGITSKVTRLEIENSQSGVGNMSDLRGTLVYAGSEPLVLVDESIDEEVSGDTVELEGLFGELKSGKWVIVTGERVDIPGVTGVRAAELLMIASVLQDNDYQLPGDRVHSELKLVTPMAYRYHRKSVQILANVVKATHGETRREIMGSGDGAQSLQTFALKQPPLTFVASPSVRGIDSTLKVYVDGVRWYETDSLSELGPKDRNFVTLTGDDGQIAVIFGNGEHGARVPTGVENVEAVYRNGIGATGNVRAEQISLLATRPLGVKGVINPLRASGGAGREDRDAARANAPLAVMALDRLVSVEDYADFTRTFGGIGKAVARRLSDGQRQLVHVTIAGVDDIPIDYDSDLYQNLIAALRRYGDADLPVVVDMRERITLALAARIKIDPDRQWPLVAAAVRQAILTAFGFPRRALGQIAYLSEVIQVIQRVPGVTYVDVDGFGGIPERKAANDGRRRLLTLNEITEHAQAIVTGGEIPDDDKGSINQPVIHGPAVFVRPNLADFERGAVRPAQLAIFSEAVPETLILNQIS